ncbi:MAG: hypothetical protein EOO20_06715 [Chryseobacterium sp.]|nr:MAG: hypothetical protein EOO20_06715 [Chryseobacterium sp.]
MKAAIMVFLLIPVSFPCFSQLNVALLHQLVDNSRSEHSRQIGLRDKQAVSAASEQSNNLQQGWLKTTYRNNAKRFSAIGLTIDAVQIGQEALPLISKIAAEQRTILSLCADDPLLIVLAMDTQADLVDRSIKLLNYLYGISLSIGQINAMERADRRILSGFVVSELRTISLILSGLSTTLKSARKKFHSRGPIFSDTGKKEKLLIDQILSRIKQLK